MRTIPVKEYVEDRIEDDGSYGRAFLSYPKYHRHEDGTLHETDCTIIESQDPDWDWEVTEGVWTLYIKRDGTFQSRFHEHTVTRKPVGIGFYNIRTKTSINRIEFDLTTWDVEVGHDTITWTNPENGIIFKVWYIHDQARGIVELPQEVQTELLAKRRKSWSRENTYVSVIYDADMNFQDEDMESEDRIRHKHPDWEIQIGGHRVAHEKFGRKPNPHPPEVEREDADEALDYTWPKRKVYFAEQKKFIEACRIDALESEDGKIIFNTTDTFGFAVCEDCYTRGYPNYKNTNYNGLGLIVDGDNSSGGEYFSFIRFDLTDLLGIPGTVYLVQLYLYCYNTSSGGVDSMYANPTLKPWTEAGCTWRRWNGSAYWNDQGAWYGFAWPEGCEYGFNTLNGAGCDISRYYAYRRITEGHEDSYVSIGGYGAHNMFEHLQAQWEADKWYGWKLHNPDDESGRAYFRDSEYATPGERPYLYVMWTSSSSSSSASYSCSSCSSSSCSSSFSSSCSSSLSFSSSSSSCSSSYPGPYYVRADALGGGVGDGDSQAQALTPEEFRTHNAGSPVTYYVKGKHETCLGDYALSGNLDYSARDGNFADAMLIKGYLTSGPNDVVTGRYRPRFILGDVSLSSSSASSSSSGSSSVSSSSSST